MLAGRPNDSLMNCETKIQIFARKSSDMIAAKTCAVLLSIDKSLKGQELYITENLDPKKRLAASLN